MGEATGVDPARAEGADRLVRLASLAGRLAQAEGPHQIIDVVIDEAAAAVGMDFVDVAFLRGGALVSTQVRWPLPGDMAERYAATPLDAHLPTTEAARTDRTVLVEDLFEYQAGHRDLQADVEASGFASAAVVPFRDADGAVLGVLGLVSRSPVTLDPPTVAAIELAGELCGNALRRTQLGERASALALLATRLAGAVTTVDVAVALRDLGREPVGAVHVNCRLLDAAGDLVSIVDAPLPAEVTGDYVHVPLHAGLPVSAAVSTDEPVWIEDPDELERRFPAAAPDAGAAGFRAVASVPLHDHKGSVVGVLSFAWQHPVRFDALLRSSIMTIADLGAQAVERANLYDSEHELITALQRRLLGTIEAPPSVEIATRYLPAAGAVGIGGDWFDLIRSGPTTFTLVIGDVTGHGVAAVASMAQLRAVVNGLLRSGEPIDTLFDRAEAMRDLADRGLASVELFEVDTAGPTLRYSSAGHPWALRRCHDGTVELLDGAQHSLLGAQTPRGAPADVALCRGDLLVAYTDGLVERRREPITDGIERLAACLRGNTAGTDGVEAIADALLHASGIVPSSPLPLGDDIALVVLRVS